MIMHKERTLADSVLNERSSALHADSRARASTERVRHVASSAPAEMSNAAAARAG